jgi:serine/threonine protein kinase
MTPGNKLGQYEILSLIGAGGRGEVYRARDTKLKSGWATPSRPPMVRWISRGGAAPCTAPILFTHQLGLDPEIQKIKNVPAYRLLGCAVAGSIRIIAPSFSAVNRYRKPSGP